MTNHDMALVDLIAPLAMTSALIGCLFALAIWTVLGVVADGVARLVVALVKRGRSSRASTKATVAA